MANQLDQDFADLWPWLAMEQPHLATQSQNGFIEIVGTYLVKSKNPELAAFGPLARYEISVRVFDTHPNKPPELRELAGEIVKNETKRNHVNPDGTLCYGPPFLTWAKRPDMTLIEFFNEYVRSFFLGYLHFNTLGKWPKGEYSHGDEGVIEAISEVLQCKPELKIINGLLYLMPIKHRRDRWSCPCGSKKRLGDCCREALNKASLLISRKHAILLRQAFHSDLS